MHSLQVICAIVFALLVTVPSSPTVQGLSFGNASNRLVIGESAELADFPWIVSIGQMGHQCVGAIIAQEWIVTAASCVAGFSPQLTKVRYDSLYHNRGGTLVAISRIVIHPAWSAATVALNSNDIALVRTVSIMSVKAVPMARESLDLLYEGMTIQTAGWGVPSLGSGNLSPVLKKSTTLRVIRTDECLQSYQELGIKFGSTLGYHCVGGDLANGGPSLCAGDVGAPLYLPATGRLYGFGLFALDCGGPGKPNIFIDLGRQRYWIFGETGLNPDL